MRASRSGGLSPFRRRIVVALLAALVGVAAARIAGAFVPDAAETASLGALLFEIGVQAVVTALVWPFADGLIPPPAPAEEDSGEDV